MKKKIKREGEVLQTVGEEIANSITHGIGFMLSVAALVLCVVFAGMYSHAKVITSVAIYGATMCILYLSSTLYHAMPPGSKAKRFFHICDHSSIFLLIAGTYTPIVLGALKSTALGWTMFGLIWGLALTGIAFKAFFTGKYDILSTIIYLTMGWLIIGIIVPVIHGMGTMGFLWLLIGGICYTVGCVFYVNDFLPYAHAVWHLFVLGGTIVHFFGVLFHIVLPATGD